MQMVQFGNNSLKIMKINQFNFLLIGDDKLPLGPRHKGVARGRDFQIPSSAIGLNIYQMDF